MDRSEVKAVVDRAVGPLMARLGISHWKVAISYDPRAVDGAGCLQHGLCTRLVDYNSAHISLNPSSFDDETGVLKTLRHELFHVVLAPFDLYSTAIDRIDALDPVRPLIDRVWDHACEKAVINLERMYSGLTAPGATDDAA